MSIEAFVRKNQSGSNYELMKEKAALLLAEQDLEEAARRPGCRADGEYVCLSLQDLRCRVRRTDGFAECAVGDTEEYREADFNTAMILYDLLGYADKNARPAGEYAPIESFARVQNARSYAGEGMFSEMEQIFDRETERLHRACEGAGGMPWGRGDVSYRFPLFMGLQMCISFWYSDDEFPPSLRVLFDSNTLQYLRYETMWYAAFFCLRRIISRLDQGTTPVSFRGKQDTSAR